ncbi:MAG: hypothetical protein HN464_01215 [Candidatus Marinimicrobia bacterium]|nr:hypothetical protein [Candidatus Neomarinimicrobiota bacterium]
MNKKLPKRTLDKLTDVVSSVDLESFRLEKETEGSIIVDPNPYIEPMGDGVGGSVSEEPTDFLSKIIQLLNENYGGELTDDDKVNLNRIYEDMVNDEELKVVHHSENTDTNKRHKFDEKFQEYLLGLVEKDTKFYNKVLEKRINQYIKDRMYEFYLKSV